MSTIKEIAQGSITLIDRPAAAGMMIELSADEAGKSLLLGAELYLAELEVTDRVSADEASSVIADANQLLQKIERDRQAVKSPYLDACRKIDAISNELTQGVRTELDALKARLGSWIDKTRQQEADERRAGLERAQAVTVEEEDDADFVYPLTQGLPPMVTTAPSVTQGFKVSTEYGVTVEDQAAAYFACPQVFEVKFSKAKWKALLKIDEKRAMTIPGLTVRPEVKGR